MLPRLQEDVLFQTIMLRDFQIDQSNITTSPMYALLLLFSHINRANQLVKLSTFLVIFISHQLIFDPFQ